MRRGPLTNAVLTEHCKTFKLPHSGNKAVLTERLTSFSKDKERWTRCVIKYISGSLFMVIVSFRVRRMHTKVLASLSQRKRQNQKYPLCGGRVCSMELTVSVY
jgi:hypothetical protein